MSDNQAAFVLENRRIEVGPVEKPEAAPHEVLLEVQFCGVCGSDVHFYSHGEPEFPDVYPFVIGHEFSAHVVAVGDGVTSHVIGDRVSVEPGIPCRTCEWCATGKYNLCSEMVFLSAPRAFGGLRKFVAHPANLCHKLPENVSDLEGALVEPLAVAMNAVRQSEIRFGQSAVILGSGCIGLVTLLSLKAQGITDITVVDIHDIRLERAREFGATNTINATEVDVVAEAVRLHGGVGPDVTFETAGNRVTAAQTIGITKRGGTIMQVGNVTGDTPLDLQKMTNKELKLQTVFRYRNIFPQAISAVANGQVDIKRIVSKVFDFTDASGAFEESITSQSTMVKAVIKVGAP